MQSYFEILGVPTAFTLDVKALEHAYFAAQRACHPDRFVGKPEADRIAAITKSQQVNDAYETLKNPLTRAEHLLQLQGRDVLGEEAPVPPTLLLEMLELRERVADAADGATLAAMVSEIRGEADATTERLALAFAAGDADKAADETLRLHYLGKAMEEAHMYIYRLKAAHG